MELYQNNNWKRLVFFYVIFVIINHWERTVCIFTFTFAFTTHLVCFIPAFCISCTFDYKQKNHLWPDSSKKQIYWKKHESLMNSKEQWRMRKIRSTPGTSAVGLYGPSHHRVSVSLTLAPVTPSLYLSPSTPILIPRREHPLDTIWVKCLPQAQSTMTNNICYKSIIL